MEREIVHLANHYKKSRNFSSNVADAVSALYQHYIKKHGSTLLDSAAATAALHGIFLADQIDFSKVTPQMEEAFRLAYPNVDFSSLASRSPEEIEGFLTAWKGKYFEVLVRDELNAGEWVGDIHLEPGRVAQLAESATEPGWDLQILNSDGTVASELQLKATESLSYVKGALERYPDIQVLTTDEIMIPDELADKILSSGISNQSLEEALAEPMAPLFDGPLENLVEDILPGLPFVIIAVDETRKILIGKKSFQAALSNTIERAAKTGVALGIGWVIHLMDGGIISLPATFLTRFGIDRFQLFGRLEKNVEQSTEYIRALLPYHSSSVSKLTIFQ